MKRRYNSDGMETGTKYTPFPIGDYLFVIKKVTDTKNGATWKTKNGDDYVQVECEVDEGDYLGRKVWYGVTFMDDKSRPGAGMSIKFLKTIGEPYQGDFDIDSDNWVGKRFRARIKIGRNSKGDQVNEIAWLIDEDTKLSEDEIPF